ncbi:prolyl oligopeptidase family serine peptidase [Pelagibius litoralis]|uniref:Prolyl oligopeptidase family serine peptidase n=1 Tax=Pelagibius litoralis TaxID=374515 RepID=A0A967KAS3_9PROT|nr:prolyl oligopeptidase family serine peptidase [Pelagibius litoralis]NIA70004.1 prolyl oligopeptidase family serine peptidase [Pelagibius litoralis]
MTARPEWASSQISAAAFVAALAFGCAGQGIVSAEERVRFPSLDAETALTAFLFKPSGQPPFPAIVLLHGCSGLGPGGGIAATYSAWTRVLTARGYVVLLVDSAGSRGFGETCGRSSSRTVMYRDRPKDAYGALTFLQVQSFVQSDRIGLLGWSQGGGIVLLSVVTESIGRPRPPPLYDFKAAAAFYPSACSAERQSEPYTKVTTGSWKTEIPLLVLQGTADNWTPAAPCAAFIDGLRQRGQPVEIRLYPGALHSFDAPNLARRERPRNRKPGGVVPLVGTDPAAREDALRRVPAFFDHYLID